MNKNVACARSENGYGFYRSGLKTGVENVMFSSEIGSGFGEPGGTPPPRIPRSTPPPPTHPGRLRRSFANNNTVKPVLSGPVFSGHPLLSGQL